MRQVVTRGLVLAATAACLTWGGAAQAQDASKEGTEQQVRTQERGRRGGGQRERGRRGFDRAAMWERMSERIQEQLKATDEEWKVLGPKVRTVMEKQREARSSGFMGGRGRRGDGPPRGGQGAQADAASSALTPPQALRAALESESTAKEEIQAKLKAVREAKAKQQEEIKKLQAELREMLTLRQEAQLVLMGTLD